MDMKHLIGFVAALLLVAACSDDEKFTISPTNVLTFSADTVDVDTVFSNMPSSTRSLWVYNRSGSGIRCSSIRLEHGNQSGYRVNVDGTYLGATEGYQVGNVEIRKGDSIRVFVELTSSRQRQELPQRVEDNLIFELESGVSQKVNLKAYSWDATVMTNAVIATDTTIDSSTPIVVRGGITINEGATLTIAAGTTLYFHGDAGMEVKGTIKSLGTAANPVVMRGDRLDRMFSYLPYDRVSGQWKGLHLAQSSYGNVLEYTDIHSTFDGVVADSSDISRQKLSISCSTIHNCQGVGVSLTHVMATMENTVVSNTLNECVKISGGDVALNHCTLAQFYPYDSNRGAALWFASPLQRLVCQNSLITGYADDVVTGVAGELFEYQFENSILRTPKVETADSVRFKNVVFEDVADTTKMGRRHFKKIDTDILAYDFALDSVSIAIGKANAATSLPYDHDGRQRDDHPDIGAYEYWK